MGRNLGSGMRWGRVGLMMVLVFLEVKIWKERFVKAGFLKKKKKRIAAQKE